MPKQETMRAHIWLPGWLEIKINVMRNLNLSVNISVLPLSPFLIPSSTPRLLIQLVPGCLHALAGDGMQTGSSPRPEPVPEGQWRIRALIGQDGSQALRRHPGAVVPTQGWLVWEECSPSEQWRCLQQKRSRCWASQTTDAIPC